MKKFTGYYDSHGVPIYDGDVLTDRRIDHYTSRDRFRVSFDTTVGRWCVRSVDKCRPAYWELACVARSAPPTEKRMEGLKDA